MITLAKTLKKNLNKKDYFFSTSSFGIWILEIGISIIKIVLNDLYSSYLK